MRIKAILASLAAMTNTAFAAKNSHIHTDATEKTHALVNNTFMGMEGMNMCPALPEGKITNEMSEETENVFICGFFVGIVVLGHLNKDRIQAHHVENRKKMDENFAKKQLQFRIQNEISYLVEKGFCRTQEEAKREVAARYNY